MHHTLPSEHLPNLRGWVLGRFGVCDVLTITLFHSLPASSSTQFRGDPLAYTHTHTQTYRLLLTFISHRGGSHTTGVAHASSCSIQVSQFLLARSAKTRAAASFVDLRFPICDLLSCRKLSSVPLESVQVAEPFVWRLKSRAADLQEVPVRPVEWGSRSG